MERILVGVDASANAYAALGWSADLARRARLELIAARVFDPPQAELPPEQDRRFRDEQRAELEDWCESFTADIPRVQAILLDGDPPDALLDAAASHDADLLVVGGRGAGGFRHLHLGSVAHHLVHHTTLPLAVVPRSGADSVRHLVVGVDGSPGSLAAVDLSADLAAALGVETTVVHAFEPFVEWVPETDPASWRRRAETELGAWATPIADAGATVELDVDQDIHPVAAIARALEARAGSIAVVGARGIGGFTGLRLGRIPIQLVHHTGSAVIVVPTKP